MKLPRIFQARSLKILDDITLDKEASHRLTRVLRLTTGNQCILFNGNGYEYLSLIKSQKRNIVEIRIIERVLKNIESPLIIHVGQVLSKGEKMDFVVQKATELGVHQITPLFSARSVVHLDTKRAAKKSEHLQQIAIHAAEQCGRTRVPIIEKPMRLTEWILNRSEKTRLILSPNSAGHLKNIDMANSIAILIGPEGGLTPEEIEYTVRHQFKALSLGPRILRTETAALAALVAIQCIAGDLH